MAGLANITDDWVNGINDISIRNGLTLDVSSSDISYLISDKSISISYDSSTIKNYTKINALLQSNGGALTINKFESTGDDTYKVGKVSDILYCARYIDSFIESVTSSSAATIPLSPSQMIGNYDARFTSNNRGGKLVCRITRSGVTHLRNFTISGQTITLKDTVTNAVSGITGLSINDRFELINAYDVLPENLEATTGYPVQGYVKKHVKPNEECSITFGSVYDKPSRQTGQKVVIAYYPVQDYKQTFSYNDSINHYELNDKIEALDFPVTQDQINYIESTLQKYIEPMITIELETLRPNKPQEGWKIPVNLTGLIQGDFYITSVSSTYISATGQANKPTRLWKVTLSNYIDTLAQVISKLKRKSDLIQAVLADNERVSSLLKFNLIFTSIDDPDKYPLSKPTATAATSISSTSFTLQWNAVSGATDYMIEIYIDEELTETLPGYTKYKIGSTATGHVANNSFVGSESGPFYYRVKAFKDTAFSEWSNVITVVKNTGQFPASITVSGTTTNLNYGYIFNPQSSGDFTDYSSHNLSGVALSRNTISDTYPIWVQDSNGKWGLDFTNALFSGLKIPHSSNYYPLFDYTIIFVVHLSAGFNNDLRFLIMKWTDYIGGIQFRIDDNNKFYSIETNTPYQGIAIYKSEIISTPQDLILGYSVKGSASPDLRNIIRNQSDLAITPVQNVDLGEIAPTNVHSMGIGNFLINDTVWGSYPFKGVIKSVAFIKQYLTSDQIKEIHRILGYT